MSLNAAIRNWQNDVAELAEQLIHDGWPPFQSLAEATRRVGKRRARAARRRVKH